MFLRWNVIQDYVVFNTVSDFGVSGEFVENWDFLKISAKLASKTFGSPCGRITDY